MSQTGHLTACENNKIVPIDSCFKIYSTVCTKTENPFKSGSKSRIAGAYAEATKLPRISWHWPSNHPKYHVCGFGGISDRFDINVFQFVALWSISFPKVMIKGQIPFFVSISHPCLRLNEWIVWRSQSLPARTPDGSCQCLPFTNSFSPTLCSFLLSTWNLACQLFSHNHILHKCCSYPTHRSPST